MLFIIVYYGQSVRVQPLKMSKTKTKSLVGGRHSTKLTEEKRDALQNAWHAVKSGEMNMYRASKHFVVSLGTLFKWCKKDDASDISKVGRPVSYLESNYDQAMDAVRNQKMSLQKAAARFDVSTKTLNKRMSKVASGSAKITVAKRRSDEDIPNGDNGTSGYNAMIYFNSMGHLEINCANFIILRYTYGAGSIR